MARWSAAYGAATARAIALAHAPGARARSHGQGRRRTSGRAARRPRAADRLGAHDRARSGLAAAGLCRGRLVGAGRGRGAAGAAAWRRARPHASPTCAPRPAARPRNSLQAGARVTAVDRSPARLARLRENLARLGLAAETVAADATEWQAGPFDAVLIDAPCTVDRHHPPPSRHAVAQARGRPRRRSSRLQRRLLDRAVDADEAGRHHRLLHLLARARGRRSRRSPPCSRASRGCGAGRSVPTRSAGSPNSSRPPATCAPCPATCRIRTRAWPASTGFTPPGLEARHDPTPLRRLPFAASNYGGLAGHAGLPREGKRVHVPRVDRRNAPGSPCTWRGAACATSSAACAGIRCCAGTCCLARPTGC